MTTKLTNTTEIRFIKQLNYWIRLGIYGIEHEGNIWIYNTLDQWADQLKVSKRSIQRCISSLKQKGIIKTAYLSSNKRDRTLFYTIDYDNFNINSLTKKHVKTSPSHMAKSEEKLKLNDHMIDHMYIIDNNNIINKSYKSIDKDTSKNSEGNIIGNLSKIQKTTKLQNTTIQDMLRELKAEFPEISVFLNKNLARNLVAAFKLKFKNSITKWHEFLKLVKTSAYLMSEKFHLTIQWLLKFSTIDRLFQGDLGVKLKEVFFSKTEEEEREIQQKEQEKSNELLQQIDDLEETESCKDVRKKILQRIGNVKYETWFTKVFLTEENNVVVVNISTKKSLFVFDYIMNHFRDMLDLLNLNVHTIKDESELIDGYVYCN